LCQSGNEVCCFLLYTAIFCDSVVNNSTTWHNFLLWALYVPCSAYNKISDERAVV
jgi:hypothetical protein